VPEGTKEVFITMLPLFPELYQCGIYRNGGLSLLRSPPQNVAVSTGTGEGDFDRVSAIVEALPQLQYICVDVANGYSEHFVHFVKDIREKFRSHTIMVSDWLPSN